MATLHTYLNWFSLWAIDFNEIHHWMRENFQNWLIISHAQPFYTVYSNFIFNFHPICRGLLIKNFNIIFLCHFGSRLNTYVYSVGLMVFLYNSVFLSSAIVSNRLDKKREIFYLRNIQFTCVFSISCTKSLIYISYSIIYTLLIKFFLTDIGIGQYVFQI